MSTPNAKVWLPWEEMFIMLAAPIFNYKDVAKYLNVTYGSLRKRIEFLGVRKRNRRRVNKGDRFGNWEVISEPKNRKCWCKCSCPKQTVKEVWEENLVYDRSQGCGCVQVQSLHSKYWRGHGEISGSYWGSVKKSAEYRNLEFNITIEYAWELFLQQNRKCALSGVDIKFKDMYTGRRRYYSSASLDRIDSSKGYIPGNVQWVHKDVNRMKQEFDQEYFIGMCKLISERNIK
jgi:hypothetical protein